MITAADALAAMRTLPIRPPRHLLADGPLLILAPHPDDESLGCGGLIAAACQAGAPVFVLITTDGAGSHPGSRAYPPNRLRGLRAQEARNAMAELGLPPDRIAFLGLPDTRSPSCGPALHDAATAVVALMRRHCIATTLTTWAHDPHCDHASAHRIASQAAARTGTRHKAFPVWGWTLPPDTPLPALPTGCRIDITPHLAAKRRAIAAHCSQYAGLITDDPDGFQLPSDFLALFDGPFETILDVPCSPEG